MSLSGCVALDWLLYICKEVSILPFAYLAYFVDFLSPRPFSHIELLTMWAIILLIPHYLIRFHTGKLRRRGWLSEEWCFLLLWWWSVLWLRKPLIIMHILRHRLIRNRLIARLLIPFRILGLLHVVGGKRLGILALNVLGWIMRRTLKLLLLILLLEVKRLLLVRRKLLKIRRAW